MSENEKMNNEKRSLSVDDILAEARERRAKKLALEEISDLSKDEIKEEISSAKEIIEDCTEIRLYVGTAVNAAYQNPDLPLELGLRKNVTNQLSEALEAIGKKVEREYY